MDISIHNHLCFHIALIVERLYTIFLTKLQPRWPLFGLLVGLIIVSGA